MIVGVWIRYAGCHSGDGGNFTAAIIGNTICGFAQPFVLAAPTRYSDLWFTDKGRVEATAVASLANPLGAALAELCNSLWVNQPSDVSNLTLYIAIMVSLPGPQEDVGPKLWRG